MKSDDRSKNKRTKKRGGATRAETSPPIRWGRYVLGIILCCVLGLGIVQVDWRSLLDQAYESTNRPLAKISIESEFKFVSKEELQTLIAAKLDGRFVDLDLRDLKQTIESNAWVDSVTIARIWPDSLRLQVVEHSPIARWNNDGFISNDGELVKSGSNEVLINLPLLSGADENSAELAKQYVSFAKMLAHEALVLRGITVDDTRSWSVNINGEFTLVLGQYDLLQRLENFKYVYDSYLNKRREDISRVDMRYEQGLAVEWKKESALFAATEAAAE